MKFAHCLVATSALLAPSIVSAQQSAAPSAAERRLSAEQVEAILAEAAAKRQAAEQRAATEEAEAPSPQIRGEVGFAIGTGGYREAFGTAFYPVGEDGVAAISLDFVDRSRRRYGR